MNERIIALKELINEKRAKMIKFGKWEEERAYEIQQLITQQRFLQDEIMILEYDLQKQKGLEPKSTPLQMINAAERILKGLGL